MKKPNICVLTGYGINCDYETEYAFNLAGGNAERVHVNDLIFGVKELDRYHILVFPGGFSYGDHIAAGKVLANKIEYNLGEKVQKFILDGKLIIGICNGDQVNKKCGLLPGLNGNCHVQRTSLVYNDSGKFECRWVSLKNINGDKCVFTRGIDIIYLPVAHGEGKFVVDSEHTLKKLYDENLIVFKYIDEHGNPANGRYPANPNGSVDDIAGICNPTGRVFGMMPHPERFVEFINHPRYHRIKREYKESGIPLPEYGQGLQIFRNGLKYVRENLI